MSAGLVVETVSGVGVVMSTFWVSSVVPFDAGVEVSVGDTTVELFILS